MIQAPGFGNRKYWGGPEAKIKLKAKIKITLSYALTGLIAGVISTIVVGLVWPKIFPAIIMLDHYYGAGPGLPIIIGLVAIYSSPAAVFGGMIGGWIPKEGNGSDETILAAIFAVLLSVPFTCYGLWFFTGW